METLEIEKGKDYVTLITCTPYGVNSHRLLVRGERTVYKQSESKIEDMIKKNKSEVYHVDGRSYSGSDRHDSSGIGISDKEKKEEEVE